MDKKDVLNFIKSEKYNQIIFYTILIILLIIPFHGFLVTYIRHLFSLNSTSAFWVAFWKEALMILVVFLIFIKFVVTKKFPFKIILLDKLILALFGLALLSILYGIKNLFQAIWGLRLDFQFFFIYFLTRSIVVNKEKLTLALKVVLGAAVVVSFFGFLQSFFLPKDFLVRFGYHIGEWEPGKVLPAYQMIREGSPLFRIGSTLSGAIQLAAYLMAIILLSASLAIYLKNKENRILLVLFSFLSIFPLYHTYTRSSWLGLLGGLFVLVLLVSKNKKKIVLTGVFLAVLVAVSILILSFSTKDSIGEVFYKDIVFRVSNEGHIEGYKRSFEILKSHPFGIGVGKTGLATLRFEERVLNENWYLQIATEMGYLGLFIFFGIMYMFWKEVYQIFIKSKDKTIKGLSLGLLTSFVGFSIVGLFLHAWGDNTTLALTFWALTGILLSNQIDEISNKKLKRKARKSQILFLDNILKRLTKIKSLNQR